MELVFNYSYRKEEVELFPLEKFAQDVLRAEDCPDNTCVSISFVSNEEIHKLNKQYRNVDSATDVLSFECDGYDDDFDEGFELPEFELGDIFIAPDIAEKQAKEFGTTLENELSLLIAHGLLHLIGYDHMNDDEACIMEARETEILNAHGYIRQEVKG